MTTTLEIDLADILEDKYPHGFHAPADIDISNFLEFADDDWMHQIDIEELLADKRLIGIIWNVQIVLDERPDLDDEQAWNVLRACQSHFEQVTERMRESRRNETSRGDAWFHFHGTWSVWKWPAIPIAAERLRQMGRKMGRRLPSQCPFR